MNEAEDIDAKSATDVDKLEEVPSARPQFGIAALFWTTFLIGLALAYLQRQNSPDVIIDAFFAIAIGAVAGAVIGWITGQWNDALFWSTLVAAFGYISTAADPIYVPMHRLAWATVGAFTGGIAATVRTDQRFLNGMACAIAAGLVMGLYAVISKRLPMSADARIDLVMAPLIGVAVAAFVQTILWLESKQRMPRYFTASWLMAAVVIGNCFAN